MGLLTEGTPLPYESLKEHSNYVKLHGIRQFINVYKKWSDREKDQLKWGDEIEYLLVHFDDEKKQVRLSLRAMEILEELQKREHDVIARSLVTGKMGEFLPSIWRPEHAAFMVEGTPGVPYGSYISSLNQVENNMVRRRQEVKKYLKHGEAVICLSAFPRIGCPEFSKPSHKPTPREGISRSMMFADEVIAQSHPRYGALTLNTIKRRGEQFAINVPLFMDENTPNPFVEDFTELGDDGTATRAALPNHIFMDAMGTGMGSCCLQVTFQAFNADEARFLYDQLVPMCPIMLALTAGTPAFRGLLADTDARWNVLAACCDDRTRGERGLEPLKDGEVRINKSRYDSVDCYITKAGQIYNDIPVVKDEEAYKILLEGGVDEAMAQHISHIFLRKVLILYSEQLEIDDEQSTELFENINSSVWQTLRFKPPSADGSCGWRVEFRPMEMQITEFENAAYAVFLALLTRVIISYKLNFMLPISLVEENMKEAQKKDAAINGKFWFRRNIFTGPPENGSTTPLIQKLMNKFFFTHHEEYDKMTLNEIFNGKDSFPGLLALVRDYLRSGDIDIDTTYTIFNYLRYIRKKASGELKTTAKWIRDFVRLHKDYAGDSRIDESVNYDLIKKIQSISNGETFDPTLSVPKVDVGTITDLEAADLFADGNTNAAVVMIVDGVSDGSMTNGINGTHKSARSSSRRQSDSNHSANGETDKLHLDICGKMTNGVSNH